MHRVHMLTIIRTNNGKRKKKRKQEKEEEFRKTAVRKVEKSNSIPGTHSKKLGAELVYPRGSLPSAASLTGEL